ncbi:hypothetical protein, partial [Cronobacter muytjensii]|uniref:hypothetical protein n=1 Tax=Cronobacter muytjensii TaxID=413501 RepID=UPI001F219B46
QTEKPHAKAWGFFVFSRQHSASLPSPALSFMLPRPAFRTVLSLEKRSGRRGLSVKEFLSVNNQRETRGHVLNAG